MIHPAILLLCLSVHGALVSEVSGAAAAKLGSGPDESKANTMDTNAGNGKPLFATTPFAAPSNDTDNDDADTDPQDVASHKVLENPAAGIEVEDEESNTTGFPLSCNCSPDAIGQQLCSCNDTSGNSTGLPVAPSITNEFAQDTVASTIEPANSSQPSEHATPPASKKKYPLTCICTPANGQPKGIYKCNCNDNAALGVVGTTVEGFQPTGTPRPAGARRVRYPLTCKCARKEAGGYNCVCNVTFIEDTTPSSGGGLNGGAEGAPTPSSISGTSESALIGGAPAGEGSSVGEGGVTATAASFENGFNASAVPSGAEGAQANETAPSPEAGNVTTAHAVASGGPPGPSAANDTVSLALCGGLNLTNGTDADAAEHTNWTFVYCVRESPNKRKPKWEWHLKPNGKGVIVHGKWVLHLGCPYGCVEAFEIDKEKFANLTNICKAEGWDLAQPAVYYHTDWHPFQSDNVIAEHFRKKAPHNYERLPPTPVSKCGS